MSYPPSIQASMELRKRFDQAVARKEIPEGIPFVTKIVRDGDSLREFCLGPAGAEMTQLGSVSFRPNITDAFPSA